MKHLILETEQDEQNLLAVFNGIKNYASVEENAILGPVLARLKGQIKEMPVAETGETQEVKA